MKFPGKCLECTSSIITSAGVYSSPNFELTGWFSGNALEPRPITAKRTHGCPRWQAKKKIAQQTQFYFKEIFLKRTTIKLLPMKC